MLKKQNSFWLIVLAGTAFGASSVAGRAGVLEMPPMTFLLLRYVIAVSVFALIFLFFYKPTLPKTKMVWWNMVVVGLGLGTSQLLFAYASIHLSSGIVSMFVAMTPIITAIIAPYIASEHINRRTFAGLVLAFTGVLIIFLTKTNGLDTPTISMTVYAVAAAGAIFNALNGLYMSRTLKTQDVTLVTFIQMLTCAIILLPPIIIFNKLDISHISHRGWIAIGFSGLGGSVAGFWFIAFITKYYGATKAAMQTYVVPVAATLLGFLLLNEKITVPFVAALVVILVGLFIATYKKSIAENIEITNLKPEEWQDYKKLRLESLQNEPQAFGSSYEDNLQKPDEYWKMRLENVFAKKDFLLFAKKNGVLVGMVGAMIDDSHLSNAAVISMYVKKEARGKGVAKKLIVDLLNQLRLNGIQKVELAVNKEQTAAVLLYKKLGFTVFKEEESMMGDGKYYKELSMELAIK